MKTYGTIILTFAIALPPLAAKEDHVASPNRPTEQARREQVKVDPANQGISVKDLVTTRDINQLISFSKGLSATARDVRVNTYKGRVTLRGVVESAEEKQQIEKLALSIAGPGNILNEIKVRAGIGKN